MKVDGSTAHDRIQKIAYGEALNRWKWWTPNETALFNKEEFTKRLQKDAVKHFRAHGADSRPLALAWIENFEMVSKWVPPRVNACLLRSGFYGWPTRTRFGDEGHHRCRVCGNAEDSLKHLRTCALVRRLFSSMLPGSTFCPWNTTGHIRTHMNLRDHVIAVCCMHAVYECRLYHDRTNSGPAQSSTAILREFLRFRIDSTSGRRNKLLVAVQDRARRTFREFSLQ